MKPLAVERQTSSCLFLHPYTPLIGTRVQRILPFQLPTAGQPTLPLPHPPVLELGRVLVGALHEANANHQPESSSATKPSKQKYVSSTGPTRQKVELVELRGSPIHQPNAHKKVSLLIGLGCPKRVSEARTEQKNQIIKCSTSFSTASSISSVKSSGLNRSYATRYEQYRKLLMDAKCFAQPVKV